MLDRTSIVYGMDEMLRFHNLPTEWDCKKPGLKQERIIHDGCK